MTNHWDGKLEFDTSATCTCEEPVEYKYTGIVRVRDDAYDGRICAVSLNSQEIADTVYSVKSTFHIERNVECLQCNKQHVGTINCVLSYTHPLTDTSKLMVVIMDGEQHQVISVPVVSAAQ